MKKLSAFVLVTVVGWSVVAAAAESGTAAGARVGQLVPPFQAELLDVSGAKPSSRELDARQTQAITAYIFVATRCPATQAYAERLTQLEQTYGARGVEFVYLYPNRDETRDAKIAFHKERKFKGPLVDDQGARLARLFGAQRTSELFLTDKKGTVVYHGAIDDARDPSAVKQRFLALALDATLAGKAIATTESQVSA